MSEERVYVVEMRREMGREVSWVELRVAAGIWAKGALQDLSKRVVLEPGRYRLVESEPSYGSRSAYEFDVSVTVPDPVFEIVEVEYEEPVVGSVDMSTVAEHEGDPS